MAGALGERKYQSKVLNDTNSHGAMPWTTYGLTLAMGCTKEERDAVIDDLEIRPKEGVHAEWSHHKLARQQKAEHKLAARVRRRDAAAKHATRPDRVIHDDAPPARTLKQLKPTLRHPKVERQPNPKRL